MQDMERLLAELEADYHQLNRRQYNLMEVYLSGGEPQELLLACTRALLYYESIYQPYFRLLAKARLLLTVDRMRNFLQTARLMKQTMQTTRRIISQLDEQRKSAVEVPLHLEHLVHQGSLVEAYLRQGVPFPDEKEKWEWLATLAPTPITTRMADWPMSELLTYTPFRLWYLPRLVGTLNQYLLKHYKEDDH